MSTDPNFQLPTLFDDADHASLGAQRAFHRGLLLWLAAAVLVAIFGLVQDPWAGFASAGAFAAALVIGAVEERSNPERAWYEQRAVAESVKSLAWKCAVGGGEFEIGDGTADEVDARFVHALAALRSHLSAQPPQLAVPVTITDEMRRIRDGTLAERRTGI